MSGILFFIFSSCEPLIHYSLAFQKNKKQKQKQKQKKKQNKTKQNKTKQKKKKRCAKLT